MTHDSDSDKQGRRPGNVTPLSPEPGPVSDIATGIRAEGCTASRSEAGSTVEQTYTAPTTSALARILRQGNTSATYRRLVMEAVRRGSMEVACECLGYDKSTYRQILADDPGTRERIIADVQEEAVRVAREDLIQSQGRAVKELVSLVNGEGDDILLKDPRAVQQKIQAIKVLLDYAAKMTGKKDDKGKDSQVDALIKSLKK